GEGPVREQDGPVRARGYALAQGFGGGVRTHRDAGYLPAAALLYLDGGFQGVGVQWIQYGRDARADEAARDRVHFYEVDVRHLLYADEDVKHRAHLQSGHGRPCRGSVSPSGQRPVLSRP